MEPFSTFQSYNFEKLDRSWIKNVCDSSFKNIENIPIDYLSFLEKEDIIKILNKTCVELKNWSSQDEDKSKFSWETLLSSNLDVQALLAVLAYFIKEGQAFDANQNSRQSCLRATSLYFVLLSIPGSNTYQIFNSDLYESALKTLDISHRLNPCDPKTIKKSNLDFLNGNYVLEEEDFQLSQNLPKSQTKYVTNVLNNVVFDLVTMLKTAATFLDICSLEKTVFHLVEMTKLANEPMSDLLRASKSEASINSLAYKAYMALRFLCNPKHAKIAVITRIICKHVLSQLLISNTTKLPPKQMTMIRDSTIHFLQTILEKHGHEAQEALVTLMQHLMIKFPERLEGRQKQAVIVIKLFNIYEGNTIVYKQCLKDLMLFSVHNKISCRIFAQEIIGKYLLDLSTSHNHHLDNNNWSSSDTTKLLLAAALSRCVDSSSMVRGRAIATFAEYTDLTENPQVRSIFRGETQRETPEMANHEELVAAIDEDEVNKILPNFRGVIAMLKQRSEDERALVRRSSLQALRNGIIVIPELLDEVVPLITRRCRDAALIVRKFAIRVFTTLLETYPENSSLCKHWVNSVVPLVYDTETKVKEEVLNSLEKLIVEKISRDESGRVKTVISDLPWKILREFGINKMGDHLAEACNIWVGSRKINSSTIANIKSHIGTENNLEAWLLLASLAENKSLGNMENYYSYFEKALKEDSNENGFFASVVLQVLRHSWPSFEAESLKKIQDDILKCLKLYRVRETLISHCLDIIHGIGLFRNLETTPIAEGAKSMQTLMALAEATIIRLVDAEDGETEDPDSGKIILRATCTLGHASFLCTEKIAISTLRILQGFLLEWDSLPTQIKATEELQGVAVTVLGQQSLRDREIAQEMTPIFGRLLRNTSDNPINTNIANSAAVRINASKVLADISVRFAALVEPFLPDMCVSMKDPNPQVRQVILVIFIKLLADDFIQINGPFFFNILSMLYDSDETIRQMTVFLIKERLISKKKSLVTQQFINCIYHFNGHEISRKSKRKKRSKELVALTIPGEKGAKERRLIYDFLLELLDPPGKLTIVVGLTRQILECRCTNRCSGLSQLNVTTQKGISIFKDALYVLASENLQPNSCTKQNIDDENLEETTSAPATSGANSVIVEAMKKHRLQIVLPGLMELKERLARTNSPLVVDIAKFISNLLSDYNKDQLENLYNEYPQLEKEIERDIRECDDEERISDEDGPENFLASSTPKKSTHGASVIVNPDWMPRIVLRRISTLTYPEISQLCEQTASGSQSDNCSMMTKTAQNPLTIGRRSSNPRVILRRIEKRESRGISELRIESDFETMSDSKDHKKASTSCAGERPIPRRTRSSSSTD